MFPFYGIKLFTFMLFMIPFIGLIVTWLKEVRQKILNLLEKC